MTSHDYLHGTSLSTKSRFLLQLLPYLCCLLPLTASPLISEFLAVNDTGLTDSDGATSDWIEIHNPDTLPADLEGWSLTDDPAIPAKWIFPAGVSIPADGRLLVFASGKDRRIPTAELHTNFSLDGNGEYLALIDDGNTVVHDYTAEFVEQFPDVSYGIEPVISTEQIDLFSPVTTRYLVPTGSIGDNWKGGSEPYDDSTWTLESGTSLSFASDEVIAYQVPGGTSGTQNYGGALGMDFTVDSAVEISHLGAFDDNSNGMSRTITVQLWERNDAGTPGNSSDDTGTGVLATLQFTSGSPGALEGGHRFKALPSPLALAPGSYTIVGYGYGSGELNGNNNTGFSTPQGGGSISFVGSSRYGTAGTFPSTVDVQVSQYGAGSFKFVNGSTLSNAMKGSNASVFTRYGFNVTDPGSLNGLDLTVDYDDGFVAWLNGVEVARKNAPAGNPVHNAAALLEEDGTVQFDLSAHLTDLISGNNVLTVQGLNLSANDADFLLNPRLEGSRNGTTRAFFPTPTPTAVNGPGVSYPGVLINELHYNSEDKTQSVEFIELHNAGATSVDLSGWQFTNGVTYTFPGGTVMDPGSYLVVAASPGDLLAEFGITALGPWTGNLSSLGETVELRDSFAGVVDRVNFQLGFPWPTVGDSPYNSIELAHPQFDNDLAGSWRASQAVDSYGAISYVARGSANWHYRHGTSEASSPVEEWRGRSFLEDGSWTPGTGVFGFGTVGSPALSFDTSLTGMQNNFSTVYFRHEFTIDDGIIPDTLTLNYIAEDGAVVYINGWEAFRIRVPDAEPAHDATATNASPEPTDYLQASIIGAAQHLVPGVNVLAVHGINGTLNSGDFAFAAELIRPAGSGHSAMPSPGLPNSGITGNLPPQTRQVSHFPERPNSTDSVSITAKVTDPDGVASVTLHYQEVDPGSYLRLSDPGYQTTWTDIPMFDDGTGGDTVASDRHFTAVLPPSLQVHRRLIRYRITVTDSLGASVTLPYEDDPQPNFAYFVYDGIPDWSGADRPGVTPVETFGTSVMTAAPAYHLIAVESDVLSSQYSGSSRNTRFYGTLIYDGKIYDHIQFNIRGEFSTYVTGKNKWRLRFSRGHYFQARDNYGKKLKNLWKDMKFNAGSAPWTPGNRGAAGIPECLSFRLIELAGVPSSRTHYFQLRIIDDALEADPASQYEGDLWGLYHAIEVPDGRFLDDRNLPDGNVYKLENPFIKDNQGAGEPIGFTDINAARSNMTGGQSETWWRNNVDHESYARYKAVCEAVTHYDQREQAQGYYFHNPDTNKWQFWPWDLDTMFQLTAKYYTWDRFRLCLDPGNPTNFQEGINEQREVLDLLFNANAVDTAMGEFIDIVNPSAQTLTLADLDRHMWNYHPRLVNKGSYNKLVVNANPGGAFFTRTIPTPDHEGQMAYMREFLQPGGFGYDKLVAEVADPDIPNTPAVTYTGGAGFSLDDLHFQSSAFSDASGSFAKMKWQIGEISDPTAPNYNPLQAPPYEIDALWETEISSFIANVTVPSTNLRSGSTYRVRVKHQDDTGRWSHWSTPVEFTSSSAIVDAYTQHLVISEFMYDPPEPSTPAELAISLDAQDFEFVELLNTGPSPLDLSPVSFTDGITGTLSGQLASGDRLLLVKNQAAFEARYGTGLPVVGEYSGKLSNAGETITLSFGLNQIIRSFAWSILSPWPEEPAGDGASLVLIAPQTNPDHGVASNWRASFDFAGNPGTNDTVEFSGDPLADSDGDNLSALLEHAFGSSDFVPNPSPFSLVFGALGDFTVSFPRKLAAEDVTIEIQLSTDLVNWNPAGASATLTDTVYDELTGIQVESWRIQEGAFLERYMRLIVSQR